MDVKQQGIIVSLSVKTNSAFIHVNASIDTATQVNEIITELQLSLNLQSTIFPTVMIIYSAKVELIRIYGTTTVKLGKGRSSPSKVFLRKGVLKICSKFTGKHPCQSAKIALLHVCSPVNFLYIFRTRFPKNTFEGLLLERQLAMECSSSSSWKSWNSFTRRMTLLKDDQHYH